MHTLNAEYCELLFEKQCQTPASDVMLSKTPMYVDVIFKRSQQNGVDFEVQRTLKVIFVNNQIDASFPKESSSFKHETSFFYVLLNVYLGIILVNNQLDKRFLFMYVYIYSLHVSGSHVPITRRINCINTTFGICHLYRVTYTRCIDTINSPDDGHVAARNM
jgi:hypothetical protein